MSDCKDHEDDDEEEEEGELCLLRALFGNIDRSGALDLDDDFLDEDAQDHLSALTVSCKDSLINIEKSDAPSDIGGKHDDYGRKADNAVDFQDEEELVEDGTQAHHEEAISQDQSFYAQAALAGPLSHLEEDENYDEDDECDKDEGIKEDDTTKENLFTGHTDHPQEGDLQGHNEGVMVTDETGVFSSPEAPTYICGSTGHEPVSLEVHGEVNIAGTATVKALDEQGVSAKPELPVLYEEDGNAVLWFSELFGQPEFSLLCRKDRKRQKALIPLKGEGK